MKKFYLILVLLPIATLCMAQIGPGWWQFLPEDFEENPYERQTVMVQLATDATVTESNSLDDIWSRVGDEFMYPIDALTTTEVQDFSAGGDLVTLPIQSPEDYTGAYTLISGDQALYVLYKVIDDDFNAAEDFAELHVAPYGGKFDPGREIFPDTERTNLGGYWWTENESYVWGWDTDTGAPGDGARIIPGVDYVEMAKYGSWTETGAYKVELPLVSSAEVFPGAIEYSLLGDNQDILGDVSGGAIPIAMQTLLEPTADGYYFLVLIPWDLIPSGKMVDVGDEISIALKINDYDADNFSYRSNTGATVIHNYHHWGATDNNDAYWAIAYYGARAVLQNGPLLVNSFEPLTDNIDAFYAGNQLTIKSTDANLSVTVYDVDGKIRGQFKGDNQINMSFLNPGYYIANISDENGNRSIVKFVKIAY